MENKQLLNSTVLPIQFAAFTFMLVAMLILPDLLYAQTAVDSNVGAAICWVADNFQGNAGRGIATIGISTIGILALVGRVTWSQALVVGVGCSVLFGAPQLAGMVGASGTCP